ncbi:carboxypeptidase regulatory-like domain-containing protein [Candidatus Poribacteria bacterium]|nr:carboxypeptidase regulatory-like domain-containing protein [Candidatus Poribacteria bacterium]
MKHLQLFLILPFLILVLFACGSAEDPLDPMPEVEIEPSTLMGEVDSIEGVTVQVRLLKDGILVAQVEADGSYEFKELEAGNYTIQVSAQGYETTELNATVAVGETKALDRVTLEESAVPVSHIKGVLTDADTGEILSGVLVQLTDKSGEKHETLTAADGTFIIENLPVDQAFTIMVSLEGYNDGTVNIDPIAANETYELDVVLTAIPVIEELDPGQGLSTGSEAPEFELPNGDGDLLALGDLIGSKKVVVIFYRGGW